jgi:hypothetical protein
MAANVYKLNAPEDLSGTKLITGMHIFKKKFQTNTTETYHRLNLVL